MSNKLCEVEKNLVKVERDQCCDQCFGKMSAVHYRIIYIFRIFGAYFHFNFNFYLYESGILSWKKTQYILSCRLMLWYLLLIDLFRIQGKLRRFILQMSNADLGWPRACIISSKTIFSSLKRKTCINRTTWINVHEYRI